MKLIRALFVVVTAGAWWGCGGSGSSSPSQPSLTSISVASSNSTMWVALNTEQFTATGHYSNGTTQDLTASANWSSSSPSTASVASGGVVTPLTAGAVTISASSAGVKGSANANVIGLTTAYISPTGPVLSLTGSPSSAQLTAYGVWADGKTVDVSNAVSWSSSNANVATVNASGNVTRAANTGYSTISANWKSTYVLSTAVSVTSQTMSNSNLLGSYVFLLNGVDASGPAFFTGLFTADGSGSVTGELVSTSRDGIIAMPAAFTGAYNVFPDGRGDLSLNLPAPLTITQFRFALTSDGSQGRVILFDATKPTAMMGAFQKQSPITFTDAILQGTYVFKLGGADSSNKPQTIVGMLSADGGRNVISGTADWNDNGAVNAGGGRSTPLSVTGSYLVYGDGHGAMTLNFGTYQLHFAMFVVSPNLFRLICTDPGEHLLGQFELQQVPSGGFQTMDGEYTYLLENGGRAGVFGIGGDIQIGPMNLWRGWANQTNLGTYNDLEITQGTRSMGLNGRGTLDLTYFVRPYVTYANYSFAVYMVSPARMYWIETDPQSAYSGLAMGLNNPQGTMPTPQLSGEYIYMAGGLSVASGTEASLLSVIDATTTDQWDGTFDGIVDANLPAPLVPGMSRAFGSSVVQGTYTSDPSSTYLKWQVSFGQIQNFTFYINSPNQALMFGGTSVADNPDLDGWLVQQ